MCVKIQAMVLVKVNMKLQKYAELGPEGGFNVAGANTF